MDKTFITGTDIICKKDELINLIQTLIGGIVEIETEPMDCECGCMEKIELPLYNITKIWITIDDVKSIFKYSYPQYLSLFDDYKISLKLVRN